MQPALYTIIGGNGFVGSRLAAILRTAGHSVFVPQRDDPRWLTQPLGRVLYCAGLTADFAARPFDTVQAHVGLLARVLQESNFVHLVYLSSTRLYDSLGDNKGLPADENLPLLLNTNEPRHLYDLSKALGENLCLSTASGRTAVARLSNVYDWQKDAPGFLSAWLQRASVEKNLLLDSAGGVVRDYIHLDDAVAALSAMSAQHATGIVNVASGENVSNDEIAEVFRDLGWSITLRRQTPLQRPARCAVERLAALGVRPQPVRDVLRHCLTTGDFDAAA